MDISEQTQSNWGSAVIIPPISCLKGTVRENNEQTSLAQNFLEEMSQSDVDYLQYNAAPEKIKGLIPGLEACTPESTLIMNGDKFGKLRTEVHQTVLSEEHYLCDPQFARVNFVPNNGMQNMTASAAILPILETEEMLPVYYSTSPYNIGPVQQSAMISAIELGYNETAESILSQCLYSNKQSFCQQALSNSPIKMIMDWDNNSQYTITCPENNHGSRQETVASVDSARCDMEQKQDYKEPPCSKQTPEKNRTRPEKTNSKSPTPRSTKDSTKKTTGSRRYRTQPIYEKPLDCPLCNRQFSTKSSLSQHIKQIHSGPMNHRCNKCGKQYGNEKQLIKHQLNHDKSTMSYVCLKCPKRYRHKGDLVRHISLKHETSSNKFTFCRYCSKLFIRGDQMRMHEVKCKMKSAGKPDGENS